MTQKHVFETVDAMDARAQFGELLNRVNLTHMRYIIQRRGKPKALLVPLEDQNSIEGAVSTEKAELDIFYEAISALEGVIDDPNGHDVSQTIDDVLYSGMNITQPNEVR